MDLVAVLEAVFFTTKTATRPPGIMELYG